MEDECVNTFAKLLEKKIEMIKYVRKVTNCGLVEAKVTVEFVLGSCYHGYDMDTIDFMVIYNYMIKIGLLLKEGKIILDGDKLIEKKTISLSDIENM
jgi:hypothetical protein